MAAATAEAPKGREEAKASETGKSAEGQAAAPAAAGGIKAWLPLIAAVVVMPVLAYATTHFVLLPKMEKAISSGGKAGPAPAEATATASATKEGDKGASDKAKITVAIPKLLVNVAGTMGTRYLMTSLTLVGNSADFKSKLEDNMDQLKDLAQSSLGSKTIADLEKPGARNVIRTELLTVFNNALGGPVVQEIYITELAIQ